MLMQIFKKNVCSLVNKIVIKSGFGPIFLSLLNRQACSSEEKFLNLKIISQHFFSSFDGFEQTFKRSLNVHLKIVLKIRKVELFELFFPIHL